MKNILNKIKKKLHNAGSSLILVIVALGFIGILVGALLTAAGYVYRLKLYDYNARSNFYYLDQAMDEVYASVGALTMNDLMLAYEKTREEIIYFDPVKKTYVNMSESEANAKFKENFVNELATDESFELASIKKLIGSSITNSSITFDDSKVKVKYVYLAQKPGDAVGSLTPIYLERDKYIANGVSSNLAKIVIQNVKLVRTVKYNRSSAKGVFQQSLSTDIEIARPDFDISFDNTIVNASTLFDYCLVADSGVDFDRITSDVLTIGGNVYAASDFYNKDYNNYDPGRPMADVIPAGSTEKYPMNKVSNYSYTGNSSLDTLYNKSGFESDVSDDTAYRAAHLYDGKNLRSRYSGFYVDGGKVNILADTVIVPGSISVMNGGNLAVYGVNSGDLTATNVWADEIVLGGYSLPTTNSTSDKKQQGSVATFNSNLYVKDDTTIDSEYSKFKLDGSYYGFSNSERSDGRRYIPTTAKQKDSDIANIYEKLVPQRDADGNIIKRARLDSEGNEVKDKYGNVIYDIQFTDTPENRGHYNSSAVIVNGQNSVLDFSNTKNIFIAGRSYIELSKAKTATTKYLQDPDKGRKGAKSDDEKFEVNEALNQYDPALEDYKTGESISLKSSQIAYYPDKAGGSEIYYEQAKADDTNKWPKDGYIDGLYFYLSSDSTSLKDMKLITKYFGVDGMIPISEQEEKVGEDTRVYRYIDFDRAVLNNQFHRSGLLKDFPTETTDLVDKLGDYSNEMLKSFIQDYYNYFNFCVNADSQYKLAFLGYEAGYDNVKYSSVTPVDDISSELNRQDMEAKYKNMNLDTYILDTLGSNGDRDVINKRAVELQNTTKFSGFKAGQIAVPDNKDNKADSKTSIYSSGGVTSSGEEIVTTNNGVEFTLKSANNSLITSELIGENNTDTSTDTKASDFAKNTNNHYNYYRWALRDLDNTKSGDQAAIDILDAAIDANGESCITPINYYMNYNVFDEATFNEIHPRHNDSGTIVPANLTLGDGEYRVWASEGDVKVSCDPGDTDKEVTGIVVAKGDVFFDNNVNKFNGLIITGGKVHITLNNKVNYISSTSLCRNILNDCLVKAVNYSNLTDGTPEKQEAKNAINFLKLFKDYEKIAEQAEDGSLSPDTTKKDITTINYDDVIKYNNWLRNVD
ncbi:MAG: hypothetical protein J6M65_06865 [Eubacterium sp.]|nr:hypothetical protein [Eubacterium sp.]